jgi:hypothetical protein
MEQEGGKYLYRVSLFCSLEVCTTLGVTGKDSS